MEEVLKPKRVVSKPSTKIRVHINKVGGTTEDDEGNTTLPIEINKVKSKAIVGQVLVLQQEQYGSHGENQPSKE